MSAEERGDFRQAAWTRFSDWLETEAQVALENCYEDELEDSLIGP